MCFVARMVDITTRHEVWGEFRSGPLPDTSTMCQGFWVQKPAQICSSTKHKECRHAAGAAG